MRGLIKIFLISLLIFQIEPLFATEGSTTVPTTPNNTMPRFQFHFTAIVSGKTMRNTFYGQQTDTKYVTGYYISPSYDPTGSVMEVTFMNSPVATGTAPPYLGIPLPYTGSYTIGGKLILYKPRSGSPTNPSVCIVLSSSKLGVLLSTTCYSAYNPSPVWEGDTQLVIDVGQALAASSSQTRTFAAGDVLHLQAWELNYDGNYPGLLFIAGSYISVDSN